MQKYLHLEIQIMANYANDKYFHFPSLLPSGLLVAELDELSSEPAGEGTLAPGPAINKQL